MKIRDILEHFLSRADWVSREKTVDRVIVGDADRDVDSCAVAWIPSFDAVREVVRRGFDLLICHEPTFWDHLDDHPSQKPGCLEKLRFLEMSGLTILRNHDCWDRWPDIGIPSAWARFLGLDAPPAATTRERAQHRYDIDPVSFEQFAAQVAARTAAIGEPAVEVVGKPDQYVSRIGIGTGCISQVGPYVEMGCDCCIVVDDGTAYWRDIQHAQDLGIPVICVNHCTAEEPGMVTLTRYINEHLDGLTAEHLPQGCRFRLVSADDTVVEAERPS
jgi:putative NIF3 family GTP cyclohydrolase 1 type 2